MMLPTHAMAGLAVAAPISVLAPELAPAALAGALVGSVFPDFDLYTGHRRTLHYPTIYALLAVPAVALAAVSIAPAAVALAAFLVGATVHCRMDRYGGGLELRPWEETSERAVYDHVRGRWRRPKRWIRYDGSPGDLALLAILSLPLLVGLEGPFRVVAAAALVVGVTYVVLRRQLATIAPVVFGYTPETLSRYVPERYRR
ncbi:metal-dependent hydrolase [Halorubrum sp. 48-1-W]|uniref:metal-dependent hydrolase n=1 Tax=Halorubrum sp. 48-1-W TaxID=2249761 RepID=UPI000DCDE404|nr:metal-dependent hydrolase [Halorubrum sp. 48-1-W]RAW47118.1 metal-dependent hydrolase [Halorubrum sp. 48-1-W]